MSSAGVSDIIGVLPGGRALAIEVKRPGNSLSREQEKFLNGVIMQGDLALVAYDVMDAIRVMEPILESLKCDP